MDNNINFNNLHCLICGSTLIFQYLKENKQILVCSNINVNLFIF